MAFDLDTLIDRRRLKRRLRFWRLAAVLAIVALIFVFAQKAGLQSTAYVARISVDDIILEDAALEQAIADVANDKNAKALIVRINSPGGSTTGSENLYQALRQVAATKPVVSVMGTLAASGGYVVAIAGDHIFARETTLTGSIGVIMEYAEFSRLFDKIGVKVDAIKSAPLKGEPSLAEPLSKEGRQALQGLIDDSYDWFVGLVAARRNMSDEKARALADGRVYTGRQAVKNGLVDALGGEAEARAWLMSERGVATDLPAIDVDLTPEERLIQQFVGDAIARIFSSPRLALDGMVSLWHPTT